MKLGLYIHLPYCLQKCHFCDFATYQGAEARDFQTYQKALLKEIEIKSQTLPFLLSPKTFSQHQLVSIYMGGGTPSIYPLSELHQILDQLFKRFNPIPQREISLEVNPGTLHKNKLKSYLNMGFSRFSLGVQTLNDALLQKIGREHGMKESLKDLQLLSQFCSNSSKPFHFSTDILFALPHQSLKEVQKDVTSLLAYEPQHISTYCLTLPSAHFLNEGRAKDREQEKMFFWLHDFLSQKNFTHYELSSFALPGFQCQHNNLYWKDEDFLGFGLSAHSYLRGQGVWGTRFRNPSTMKAYLNYVEKMEKGESFPFWEKGTEVLKLHEALTDFCHTSLRIQRGLWERDLKNKFPSHAVEKVQKILHSPLLGGLILKEQVQAKAQKQEQEQKQEQKQEQVGEQAQAQEQVQKKDREGGAVREKAIRKEDTKGETRTGNKEEAEEKSWRYQLSPRGRLLANQVFSKLTFLKSDIDRPEKSY